MNIHKGKFAWIVKVGERGQFVIPKEARDMFDIHPGDEILVLGDETKGVAIPTKEIQKKYIKQIFNDIE